MNLTLGLHSAFPQVSFFQFIVKEKINRTYLLVALLGTIIQFFIFKSLYPYADFFSDSYSYLFAAYANLDLNIWPIGYSKFLLAFHGMTNSDTAVVGFQYFLLEASALYFFFSLLYFYRPSTRVSSLLFVFLFFNPLFLYLSNYINSDPLFASLSLLWFTQLLWIIYKPRLYQIFVQAILLFFCFTVRNNAYYYPIITVIAFLLSRQSFNLKLLGMVLPFALIIPFVFQTRNLAEEMTGTKQFSLFTGWQLANNALYMYGHIQVDSNQLPTPETRALDKLSKQFYSNFKPSFSQYLADYVANYFIRQPEAPLKQYFIRHYNPKDDYDIVVAWGKSSVVFRDYGSWLIKKNPLEFARYFLLPNVKNYFLPPLEKLREYNLGIDKVDAIAQYWFQYKSDEVSSVSKSVQGKILYLYPLFFFFINLYFIGNLFWFIIKIKTIEPGIILNRLFLLTAAILIINFCFSVIATINVLRYQFFPMILCFSFSLLLGVIYDQKKSGQSNKSKECDTKMQVPAYT